MKITKHTLSLNTLPVENLKKIANEFRKTSLEIQTEATNYLNVAEAIDLVIGQQLKEQDFQCLLCPRNDFNSNASLSQHKWQAHGIGSKGKKVIPKSKYEKGWMKKKLLAKKKETKKKASPQKLEALAKARKAHLEKVALQKQQKEIERVKQVEQQAEEILKRATEVVA